MAKKSKQKSNNRNSKKQSNLPLLITAAVILCVAIAALLIPKGTASEEFTASAAPNATDNEADNDVQVIEAGGSLRIPVSEVTSDAQFYPVEIDGTRMEVIAIRDSEGNIRTAFNTCQICYSSGRGYYVQDGNTLVCQNCGNRFTVDQVEIESGGCNPWPIFAENKTVTDDYIEISYDFLSEARTLFANWKTGRENESNYQYTSRG